MSKRTASSLLEIRIPLDVQMYGATHPTSLPGLEAHQAAVKQAADTMYDTIDQAERNPDLSKDGRAKLINAAVAAFHRTRVELDKPVAALESRIRERKAGLMKSSTVAWPTDPGARMGMELRCAELRAAFAQLDPLTLDTMAASTTDPLIQMALLTAPPVVRRNGPDALPVLAARGESHELDLP